jgi:hypothetical protein
VGSLTQKSLAAGNSVGSPYVILFQSVIKLPAEETESFYSKVGAIRNQHPYVIHYVSAKGGKMFDSGEKKNLAGGFTTILGVKRLCILLWIY